MIRITDKHKCVYRKQKGYWSYKWISKEYSISIDEVKRLASETEEYLNTEFGKDLPTRIKKYLILHTNNFDLFQRPELIAKMKPVDILKIKNIGKTSLAQIAFCLEKHGYIEDQNDWLRKK